LSGYQLDPVSGARLVGGEMLQWSDGGTSDPGVPAVLLRSLTAGGSRPARVLALGPKAARAAQFLAAGPATKLDVLVRSLPDARRLASTELGSRSTVHCGGFDRLEPDEPYDLVVALDGPTRLLTPDSTGMSQREILQRMAKWVAPTGTAVALLENDLGFERLFRLEVRHVYDADSAWHRGMPGMDSRPLFHRELADTLASADLTPRTTYAAFPSADDAAVLVSEECREAPLTEIAASLVASAASRAFSQRPALVDVHDLARRLCESGEIMPFAGAWLVVAQPSSAILGGSAAPPQLPVLLADEAPVRPEWRAVRRVERSADGWQQRFTPTIRAEETRERRVVRNFVDLAHTITPGPTLEAVLRDACAAHDTRRVRALVNRYADWLSSPLKVAGEGDPRLFGTPSNVVVGEQGLQLLDSSLRFTEVLSVQLLVVRGLRDFARRLLRSGGEHPWSADASPDSITQTLVAMTGAEFSFGVIEAVARVEAELEVVLRGGGVSAEATAFAENLGAGRSQYVGQGGPDRGYREALAANGRLAVALEERSSQVTWLTSTVRARDRRVAELERELRTTHASFSYRIGAFLTWPGRWFARQSYQLGKAMVPRHLLDQFWVLARKVSGRF
jgi:hypothetical protein